jgi:hypothetical protein
MAFFYKYDYHNVVIIIRLVQACRNLHILNQCCSIIDIDMYRYICMYVEIFMYLHKCKCTRKYIYEYAYTQISNMS